MKTQNLKFCPLIFLLFLSLSSCTFLFGGSRIYVPQDFFFIQQAIDNASWGDTVVLDCGVYSPSTTGDLFPLFLRDGVSLEGVDARCVILDAQSTAAVLVVSNDSSGIVSGITFRNGLANSGGGAFVANSTLTFRDNIFLGNQSEARGSALWFINSSSVYLENNLFVRNIRAASATGTPASVEISNSTFSFINNTVAQGDDDGLRLIDGSLGDIRNNIFYANGSSSQGFGWVDTSSSFRSTVTYNLFFNNAQNSFSLAGNAYTASEANDLSSADLIFNNTQADPLFANPSLNNDTLLTGSPALNAGDPDPSFNNRDGSRNTQGSSGGPFPL